MEPAVDVDVIAGRVAKLSAAQRADRVRPRNVTGFVSASVLCAKGNGAFKFSARAFIPPGSDNDISHASDFDSSSKLLRLPNISMCLIHFRTMD